MTNAANDVIVRHAGCADCCARPAKVSLTFFLLFVFALLLFRPFFSFHPFPSKHYEFGSEKANRVLQGARRRNPRTAMELKHQETPVVAGRGK